MAGVIHDQGGVTPVAVAGEFVPEAPPGAEPDRPAKPTRPSNENEIALAQSGNDLAGRATDVTFDAGTGRRRKRGGSAHTHRGQTTLFGSEALAML
jgi:hypothetical protein